MKSPTLYIIVFLLVVIIGGIIFHWSVVDGKNREIVTLQQEKKKEALKAQEMANQRIDSTVTVYQSRIEQLQAQSQEIKYVPYEVPTYIAYPVDSIVAILNSATHQR